jgi:hypothetical protein
MSKPTLLISIALSSVASLGASEPRVVLEVQAGASHRRDTPVSFPLPRELHQLREAALERLSDHQIVEAQVLAGEHPSLVWIIRDLAAGRSERYAIRPQAGPRSAESVTCRDDGRGVVLAVHARLALRYNYATLEAPAGLERLYRRSGYIHPIQTPSGVVVTDDFAPDHAHQHGLFYAWVNTSFRGHRVDFWNQKEQTGQVRHAKVLGSEGGPVFGGFQVKLVHEDIRGEGSPVAVLNELLNVRVYHVASHFLIDVESRQECAGAEPLVVNRYHYGGFALRGSRAWFDDSVQGDEPPNPSKSGRSDFLTSEGKGRAGGNHTRPRWVDLSGLVDERLGGIAILDHPSNFRYPQPVRLHPNKPYFCFAPPVLGEFPIAPGRPYTSRYRLVVHDGPPDRESVELHWRDFAEPPSVRIVSDP